MNDTFLELGLTRNKKGEIERYVMDVTIQDEPPFPTVYDLYLKDFIRLNLPSVSKKQQPRNGAEI